jgi:hypothetical protein
MLIAEFGMSLKLGVIMLCTISLSSSETDYVIVGILHDITSYLFLKGKLNVIS